LKKEIHFNNSVTVFTRNIAWGIVAGFLIATGVLTMGISLLAGFFNLDWLISIFSVTISGSSQICTLSFNSLTLLRVVLASILSYILILKGLIKMTGYKINFAANTITITADFETKAKAAMYSTVYKEAVERVFYQNGKYMTLTKKEWSEISDWIYDYYFSTRKPPFPLNGSIDGGDRIIEIKFDELEIVDASGIAGYNRANNAERNKMHNKEMGRKKVEENAKQLQGNIWTTQEILSQGFSRAKLDNMVKHGFIKRLKQGHYERNLL